MIPLDKLRSLKRAIVHKNCPDGRASALILKDALPDLDIRFVQYDTEEHKSIEPAPNTIFCDFSPWLPKLTDSRGVVDMEDGRTASITGKGVLALRNALIKEWNDAGVVVLDHHSRDIVEPYTYGVFGENDKLECGAMLAFKHVWVQLRSHEPNILPRGRQVQHFAHLAAIRDTWKKDDPDWEAANRQASILMFFRFEQLSLDLLEDLQEGPLAPRLFERQIELARTCIKESFEFTSSKGTRVLMFQGVSATSDAAEILDNDPYLDGRGNRRPPDLVVGFHYRFDGHLTGENAGKLKLQFSTRSHTGFDCQVFAQAHGGNGHKAAAGFTVTRALSGNPYDVFEDLLDDWEGGA